MSKIVYILGAGFSSPANIPPQHKLMEKCFEDSSFLDKVKPLYKEFYLFTSSNITKPALSKIPLEDVFSLLDKSIKSAHKYRGLQVSDFIDKHRLIVSRISKVLSDVEQAEYIDKFVKKLAEKRIELGQAADQISMISMNWDDLMDKSINAYQEGIDQNVCLDYCMYDYSFEDNPSFKPSIFRKNTGMYNLKLIKLHGSINWNICHSCHKVYVSIQRVSKDEVDNYICKKCEVDLEHFMVTPTFMKEFQANHIKNIWHNAYIDLSEATQIVFIGYSFRPEDFEFKILLSRALNTKKPPKITIVDYSQQSRSKEFKQLKERYSTFFGTKLEFYSEGIQEYIEEKMDIDLHDL